MGIHITRPKILPFAKIGNENDLPSLPLFVLCLLLSVRFWNHLEAVFWRVLVDFRFRVVLSIRKN